MSKNKMITLQWAICQKCGKQVHAEYHHYRLVDGKAEHMNCEDPKPKPGEGKLIEISKTSGKA